MERNYGLDLLRVFSMFLIVILHALGHGGLLYNAIEGTNQYKVCWLMEIFSYYAVDCFGIISGYVGFGNCKKGLSVNRYIQLWLEVSFYCIIIALVMKITGLLVLSWKDVFFKSPFPVINGTYWYFTAYTGLFIMTPIINAGVAGCKEKLLERIMLLFFLVYVGLNVFVERFSLENGYSVIWLCILYIIGAIINKCNLASSMSKKRNILIAFLCLFVTWIVFLTKIDVRLGNIHFNNFSLVSYLSPTILFVAIIYVVVFSRMKFSLRIQRIIKFLSTSSFAIYLINDNPYIREVFIKDKFIPLLDIHSYYIPFTLVGFAILFVLVVIMIDKVRIFIFKIINKYVSYLHLIIWCMC